MQVRHPKVILAQLPVPQTNFGRLTGNVPLAAAWLAQTAAEAGVEAQVLPEAVVSYLGDAALLDLLVSQQPNIVGFTSYCWNIDRTMALAGRLKAVLPVRIVLGGPEITSDNPRPVDAAVDFLVFGEGEQTFQRLLQDGSLWQTGSVHGSSDGTFSACPSPYLTGHIDPGPGNIMLLETQRGCPFRCSYCYYNKARSKLTYVDEALTFQAVSWAVDHGVSEIYLLDPCLSARPHLQQWLERLAALNSGGQIGLVSEIRAEAVDEPLADRFKAAGFRWFEIGLQSITPKALELMNRRTDLAAFVRGAGLLKARGISPRIDLILGLPGDTLDGFKQTVDFLVDHSLTADVQLFPLSVLPGTVFRQQSRSLGLTFTPAPPYTVLETPTFSRGDMQQAIAYAEQALDTSFYLQPDLNIAWRKQGKTPSGDVMVRIADRDLYVKLYLDQPRPTAAVREISHRLSFPYQLYVAPEFEDLAALGTMIEQLSAANPYTPFEVIFLAPRRMPDCNRLLSHVRLKRPHFLDLEERFLFERMGNRAAMVTIASTGPEYRQMAGMVRQIYWWQRDRLPARQELDAFFEWDGLLIDTGVPDEATVQWQDRFEGEADRLPALCFARIAHQHRWLKRTAPDQWAASVLNAVSSASSHTP